MKYIINAFSPKMLKRNSNTQIKVEQIQEPELKEEKDEYISAVGHYNIAEHLGIPRKRMSIILEKGDTAFLVESKIINHEEKFSYKRLTIT